MPFRLRLHAGVVLKPPTMLPGWVFISGYAPKHFTTLGQLEGKRSPEQLATTAAEQGADSFTTDGHLHKAPRVDGRWVRCSFHPCEGSYLRESLAWQLPQELPCQRPGDAPPAAGVCAC